MLNAILKWSIVQRWLVVLGAVVVTFLGVYNLTQMPLDVFPDFAPPQVEIQTEAPGLAPEEVESLVTLPIESSVNGTPGVETVRSSSAVGISVTQKKILTTSLLFLLIIRLARFGIIPIATALWRNSYLGVWLVYLWCGVN